MVGEISYTLTGVPIVQGGTRVKVTEAMIDRSWQVPRPKHEFTGQNKCFACTGSFGKLEEQDILAWYPEGVPLKECQFAITNNSNTPHHLHALLLPAVWEPIWPWKKVDYLAAILDTAAQWHQEVTYRYCGVTNARIGFHYGRSAGQNQPHPHWHLIGSGFPMPSICSWCQWESKTDLIFDQTDNLVTLLDGSRAGQTRIIAKEHAWDWQTGVGEVAELLMRVTALFKQHFTSAVTGLDPDFILHNVLPKDNPHFWLGYVPILNQWGCIEEDALDGLGPFTLPCAQKELLQFLGVGRKEYFG